MSVASKRALCYSTEHRRARYGPGPEKHKRRLNVTGQMVDLAFISQRGSALCVLVHDERPPSHGELDKTGLYG